MNPDEPRRFSIADALILIAGLAAGFGLLRMAAQGISPGMIWEALVRPQGEWSVKYAFEVILELSESLVIPFAAAWTPACLLVQVTGPRPPWRRLRRRPGFGACLIASSVTLATMAVGATCAWLSLWPAGRRPDDLIRVNILGGLLAGSGVLGGWAAMRLCGVGRPSRTWTDRLGRLTGVVWIALGAISAVYLFLVI